MAQALLDRSSPELERQRVGKRARIHVHASAEDGAPTEPDSLLSNLARPARSREDADVEWRIHDKTHLEFAIDYPFAETNARYTWEAFFFVPESFRLAQTTYDKKQIYDDLLSYVRLAVPELPFDELAESTTLLTKLREAVERTPGALNGSKESRAAIRHARVFACMVRASSVDAQRQLLSEIDESGEPKQASALVARFAMATNRIADAYREIVRDAAKMYVPDELNVALKWVDEDISLLFETLTATASVSLERKRVADEAWGDIAARLASEAVAEARYREEHAYPSVGREDATPRDVEHIEFRRHVLKRFTASVLWLKHEVRDAATWILHGLYAFAAAIAMAFAVIATLRAMEMQEYLLLYFFLLVGSYAIKDRMKAMLQTALSRWAQRRFPDRAWTIRDEERREKVGVVSERAGFRAFAGLPAGVLRARRMTREHELEEFARPESVLWHEKSVVVEPRADGTLPSPMMTEIFRLNIGSWLAHTDDPNGVVTFADPREACVCSVTARRVYNLNVVYRLRAGNDGRWKRIRVVVSRKGIERIDPIA